MDICTFVGALPTNPTDAPLTVEEGKTLAYQVDRIKPTDRAMPSLSENQQHGQKNSEKKTSNDPQPP